jgi:copper chaperone CopZ
MKIIYLFLPVMFAALISNAQITKATLYPSGLTCTMCTKAVYEALLKVKDVERVEINKQDDAYSIFFKQNSSASPDDIRAAIVKAGFSIAKMQVTVYCENIIADNTMPVNIGNEKFHFLNGVSQKLNGEVMLTLVDKDFMSAKELKKYAAYTSAIAALQKNQRVYHVVI